ncbi:hypothetical protein GW17_00042994 [Ensete ventricosum]|nr:hypothetical protein GW17_00042994 [Ensete ventricosum]
METVLRTPPVRLPSLASPFLNRLPFTKPPSHSAKLSSTSRRRLFAAFSPRAMASPSSSQMAAQGDVTGISDAFEKIRAHQEAAVRLSPVDEIRTLLDHSTRGMLSTLSKVD